MRQKIFTFCIVAMVSIATTQAHAATPPAHLATQKRLDITVRQLAPIAFGAFASSGNNGTITIDAASGARKTTGAISVLSGGDYGQAEFIITGQPGEEIVITPPAQVTLSKSGNDGAMTITDLRVMPGEIITLDRQGAVKIKIGGTLNTPGIVPQGPYNAFFNVSVGYTH